MSGISISLTGGGLTKTGSGSLTLNGDTSVGGVLSVGGVQTVGSGSLVLNGGTSDGSILGTGSVQTVGNSGSSLTLNGGTSLLTSVTPVRRLTLTSNTYGHVFPGGSVVYSHILTNEGNVTEGTTSGDIVFRGLDSLSGNGFSTVFYLDGNNNGALDAGDASLTTTNFQALTEFTTGYSGIGANVAGLAPTESIRIFAKVQSPLSAMIGMTNYTTIFLQTTGDINSVPAPADVIVQDTTYIVGGNGFGVSNSDPIAINDYTATNDQTAVSVDVVANDYDLDLEIGTGEALHLESAVVTSGNANISIVNNEITVIPTSQDAQEIIVNYVVNDNFGGSATANLIVAVNTPEPNQAPITTNDYITVSEFNSGVIVDVLANDIDFEGEALTLIDASLSSGLGNVSVSNNVLIFNAGGSGSDTVTYTLQDAFGNTSQGNLYVEVLSGGGGGGSSNAAPIALDDSTSLYEFGTVEVDVLANDSDPDGDALTIVSVFANNGSAYINENNTISYSAGFAGSDIINYTVQDVFGNTAQANVFVGIFGGGGGGGGGGGNSLPITAEDSALTDELTPVTVDVLANDADLDGDTLTVTNAFVSTGNGMVELNADSTLTFTPNGAGDAIVIYTAMDSYGNTAESTLTITVTATGGGNTPPVANNDFAVTQMNTPLTVNVLENDSDADGDTLVLNSIAVVSGLGSVDVNADNSVTFTPNQGFVGDTLIDYTIEDSSLATADASLTVVVEGQVVGDALDNNLFGSSGNDVIAGSDGNDHILGDAIGGGGVGGFYQDGDDVLIGGLGNDSLTGASGNDTYFFNLGDGQDVINNFDPHQYATGTPSFDRLVFGVGINPADIKITQGTFLDAGVDVPSLIISINGTNDRITIMGSGPMDEVPPLAEIMLDAIEFADGTVWGQSVIFSQVSMSIVGDEFDNYLNGIDGDDLMAGLAGNDTLYGYAGNDTMDGGVGHDNLLGGTGNDSLYGGDSAEQTSIVGYEIIGYQQVFIGYDNVLLRYEEVLVGYVDVFIGYQDVIVGYEDVIVSYQDVYMGDDALGNPVFESQPVYANMPIIENQAIYQSEGVYESQPVYDSVPVYEDQPIYGDTPIYQTSIVVGNDALIGGDGDDVLAGGDGNDYLDGGNGHDTYRFNLGDGQDIINNFDENQTYNGLPAYDRLVFGAGITASNIELRDDSGHLLIVIKGTNDSVLVQNYFANPLQYGLDAIEFADGSVWTATQISEMSKVIIGNEFANNIVGTLADDMMSGMSGNDTLYGSEGSDMLVGGEGDDALYGDAIYGGFIAGSDTLEGGLGNDFLEGDGGSDTYIFNKGDGQDTIAEDDIFTDTLLFGNGINASDIHLNYSSNGDYLTLAINGTSDSVSFRNYFSYSGVEIISFADGTVWDRAKLESLLVTTRGDETDNYFNGSYLHDEMYGMGGNDSLYGNGGNDVLDGGVGSDYLQGGNGNDTYVFNFGDGQDSLYNFDDNEYYNGITSTDKLVFGMGINAADIELRSNGSSDLILGIKGTSDSITIANYFSDSSYQLDAVEFADGTVWDKAMIAAMPVIMTGDDSDNYLSGLSSQDVIRGLGGNDSLYGNDGNDTLLGGAGNDLLKGGVGHDVLNGGAGHDTLVGYDGNNIYIYDGGQDVVENTDSAAYEDFGVGDSLVLNNLQQNQVLFTHLENTTTLLISVKNSTDSVLVVDFFDSFSSLSNIAGIEAIERIQFADGVIFDKAAIVGMLPKRVVIEGTASADILQGDAGDNTYVVNHSRDVIIESANAGIDTVESSLSYILRDNLENLTLIGNANLSGTGNIADNILTGNEANNRLLAGGGNDTLYGLAGGDTLNGGEGADTMYGGLGNDIFTVENTGDVVVEFADQGFDTVNSFISYTLAANVERLMLEGLDNLNGFGNELDNTLNGNNANNYLFGDAGNDTLQGKGGADILEGGLGNDTYYVDNVGDVVTELASEGTDKVSSSISYTLTTHVEQLFLTGIAGLKGTGNSQNNIIYGNEGSNQLFGDAGNDSLNGGAGNDILDGGLGLDTLVGGAGNDTYVLGINSGRDIINNNDATGNDKLLFDAGINADQVWLRQLGNDLEVSIMGTANSVKVQNWYTDTANQLDSLQLADGKTLLANEVQTLVEAMSAFAAPALGQTSLTTAQHTVLDSVIVASW